MCLICLVVKFHGRKYMSLSLCKTFYFCVIVAVMLVIMFVYLKFLMKWKKQKWNLAGRGKGLNFIKEAYLKRLCYVLTKLGNFLATCNAMQCNAIICHLINYCQCQCHCQCMHLPFLSLRHVSQYKRRLVGFYQKLICSCNSIFRAVS